MGFDENDDSSDSDTESSAVDMDEETLSEKEEESGEEQDQGAKKSANDASLENVDNELKDDYFSAESAWKTKGDQTLPEERAPQGELRETVGFGSHQQVSKPNFPGNREVSWEDEGEFSSEGPEITSDDEIALNDEDRKIFQLHKLHLHLKKLRQIQKMQSQLKDLEEMHRAQRFMPRAYRHIVKKVESALPKPTALLSKAAMPKAAALSSKAPTKPTTGLDRLSTLVSAAGVKNM